MRWLEFVAFIDYRSLSRLKAGSYGQNLSRLPTKHFDKFTSDI